MPIPHTEEEKDFRRLLRRAEMEIHEALRLSRRTGQSRSDEVSRQLDQILLLLGRVGPLAKNQNDDPDLMSEDERANRWREARKREKK
jgi:hypothetical protein